MRKSEQEQSRDVAMAELQADVAKGVLDYGLTVSEAIVVLSRLLSMYSGGMVRRERKEADDQP